MTKKDNGYGLATSEDELAEYYARVERYARNGEQLVLQHLAWAAALHAEIAAQPAAPIQERPRLAPIGGQMAVRLEGCNFVGLNADGSDPFTYQTEGRFKHLVGLRLIGWECKGPRDAGTAAASSNAAPRDAVKVTLQYQGRTYEDCVTGIEHHAKPAQSIEWVAGSLWIQIEKALKGEHA